MALDPPQNTPGCIPGAHREQEQQIMVRRLYEALGDIPAAALW